jgi:hypothetical protein
MLAKQFVHAIILLAVVNSTGYAEDKTDLSQDDIRTAIRKSIPLLEKGSAGSAKQRKCFTCHNQAMAVLAIVEARQHGFDINNKNLDVQLKHTAAHLRRGKTNYLKGKGQGGRVSTAGHALWALEAGGSKPNETTAAVTEYMLLFRKKSGYWPHGSNRPPSGKSHFSSTYMALRGLDAFGTKEQKPRIVARKKAALAWVLKTKPKDTEDRVFRLLSLYRLNAEKEVLKAAAKNLIDTQQKDGGWSQTADMKSDAYATGSALFALHHSGQMKSQVPVYRRGMKFLLDTQRKDGSWYVKSRSKPFQTQYESGFPYHKDQWISLTASTWATMALLQDLPETKKVSSDLKGQ